MGCPGGSFGGGGVRDCLPFGAVFPGSGACLGGAPQPPSGNFCPPLLAAVDLCCPGGCPGPDFRLVSPDPFAEFTIPAQVLGVEPESAFGFTARFVGDRDNLGDADMAVGAPVAKGTNDFAGGAVFFVSLETGGVIDTLSALGEGEAFGFAMAHDFDHDMLLVGAPLAEPPQQLRSTDRGLVGPHPGRVDLFIGGQTLNQFGAPVLGGEFGAALAFTQDLDNDGFNDVVIAAPGDNGAGQLPGDVSVFSSWAGTCSRSLPASSSASGSARPWICAT